MDKSVVKIPEKFKDHPLFNSLVCGTNFGFMSKNGYYFTDFAKAQPPLMKEMGINCTTINFNICQETFCSTRLFLDFEFSSNETEIVETVKKLHENGVTVILKPCLTCLDGAAMGMVKFPNTGMLRQIQGIETDYWADWFKSYTECMKYCANLATYAKADSLMIGAELSGTEDETEHWREVIKQVRQRFDGPISYEFTPYGPANGDLAWMDELDYLSYSYYPQAAPNEHKIRDEYYPGLNELPSYTVAEMVEYLKPAKERLVKLCERFWNKPIMFTEIGTRSCHGSIILPYNFLWEARYDGEEQANYLDAVFETFSDVPYWMGLLWWKWDETQNRPHYHNDPAGDKGFTIQGKPAEAVMRRWFEKLGKK